MKVLMSGATSYCLAATAKLPPFPAPGTPPRSSVNMPSVQAICAQRPNEKVAAEAAIGASIRAGVRSFLRHERRC